MSVPLSVLDLVPVREGSTASVAMRESVAAGAARRAARLRPLLVCRASQHDEHRQLGARGAHRSHRLRDDSDSRRVGRHHAAQSRAAAHRRTVPHARSTSSRSHRPRCRACTGHRSGGVARAAAVRRRAVSRTAPRAAGALGALVSARPSVRDHSRRSRRRAAAADLGARVERRNGGDGGGRWGSDTDLRVTSVRRRRLPPIRAYRDSFVAFRAFPATARDPRRGRHLCADRPGSRLPGVVHRSGVGAASSGRVRAAVASPNRRSRMPTRRRIAWWWKAIDSATSSAVRSVW